ncbi:type ISP restriction/modification enzyme [Mariniphaga sediminis]|uniref:type ISP restriction/modification enzyme n=1 Tax=Mariniphaga sediminis TaxID=1628158 RepID=UPI003563D62A
MSKSLNGDQPDICLKSNIFREYHLLSADGLIQLDFKTACNIFRLDENRFNEISRKLGLLYISGSITFGNVCMANNPEVRPEFRQTFSSSDLLSYIYAVLHSSSYNANFGKLPHSGIPQIPFPEAETFWQWVEYGRQLRQIHLLKLPEINQSTTNFPKEGDNMVTRKMTITSPGWESDNSSKTTGRIWINDRQYFDNIPPQIWDFFIGSFRPAKKWLKDRHGSVLSKEDIRHFQKITIAIAEIRRLIKEINSD